MTIVSASSTVQADKVGDSLGGSQVFVEKLSGAMENSSAYVQCWNDVRGAVYHNSDRSEIFQSPVRRSNSEAEAWPKVLTANSVNYRLSSKVNERLKNLYAADAAATFDPAQSRVAIRIAVDAVEEAIEEGDLAALDELLSSADAQCLRKITSVAILRTSFRVRSKVSKWSKFYSEVYAHLSRTGQDAHHALRGMVKG